MLETALIAGALVVAAIPPEHTGATSARIVVQHAPLAGFPGRKASPFPQFSSPTALVLPPGAYIIWAQDPKNESRRGPELLVRLGVNKAPALDADLLVAPGL